MRIFRRLDVRLFLSYLVIVLITAGVVFATARSLAPTIFRVTLEHEQEATTTLPPPSTTTAPAPGTTPTGGDGTTSTVTVGPTTTTRPGTTTIAPTTTTTGGNGTTSTVTAGPTTTTRPGTTTTTGPGGPTSTTGARGAAAPGTYAAADDTIIIELDEEVERAFASSVTTALAIAIAVAVVVAGALALAVSRRLMLPIARVRAATVRLAEGRYGERVPEPAEAELAALASDVNRLAERLEAAESRRNRLISDVAHELRTPLTTIQGSMEGLVDGVIDPTPEVYVSVAEEASRLQRIVADLGLLSRLDEAALALDMKETDVGSVVTRVADRLRPQFEERGVQLAVSAPTGLDTVGDADRLAQVFTNLLGNALGHAPEASTVSVDASRLLDRIRVEVRDRGDGIPPEHLDRIFDRFYRVPGSDRPGTGLGLTIARDLTRAHGGDLTAHSSGPGTGARFVVDLPARETGRPEHR